MPKRSKIEQDTSCNIPSPNPELNTLLAWSRTIDILRRYVDVKVATFSSTSTQFGVLYALAIHDGVMTPTALSKWIYRTKHAVTQVLDSIEKQKLIHRKIDTNDRRSVKVILTQKGWRQTQQMLPIYKEICEEILFHLNKQQIDTTNILLKKVRKRLLSRNNTS